MLTADETLIYDAVMDNQQMEEDALGGLFIPRSVINSWRLIPTQNITNPNARRQAYRLNCFANLFYFTVQVLQKRRLQLNPNPTKNLHFQMCMTVMKDGLKEVIEIPRDHFKSTIYSEAFPIWRALPFSDKDADLMLRIGCPPLFIEWMKRAHKRDVRILLCNEIQKNAEKLGKRIRNHYENNAFFRDIFPEIIPDTSCIWTDKSLHHNRTKEGRQHGEGTYDFIGVGSALQSTHYDILVQDDLIGRDALKSETVMNDTIEYHKLLVGVMDADNKNAGRDNDEIVVGNRWSYKDLNSHIRAEEPYFNFITHSALGGCCDLHTVGTPIFPEAFNVLKLARWEKRLGTYLFSCQFLNFPINPEKCKFDTANLRFFSIEADDKVWAGPTKNGKHKVRAKIRHHVHEGDVEEDIYPRNLNRFMVVDPNHRGNKGRCRHAITITGVRQDRRRVYLLEEWAEACAIGTFVEQIFKLALKWQIKKIHLETVGAQTYLKFHLEYFITVNKNKSAWEGIDLITICDLESKNTENAKGERIDSFVPITERKEFWVNSASCDKTIKEMKTYGNTGGLIDILDTLGYGPQIWKFDEQDESELIKILNARQQSFIRAMNAAARA